MQRINKHGFVGICFQLDMWDPRPSHVPKYVCRSSAYQTILIIISPEPLQDPRAVCRSSTDQTIMTRICPWSVLDLIDVQRHSAYNTSFIFLSFELLETQEMCIRAAEKAPRNLAHILNYYRTQEMCQVAVCWDSHSLGFVPGVTSN